MELGVDLGKGRGEREGEGREGGERERKNKESTYYHMSTTDGMRSTVSQLSHHSQLL